MPPTNILWNNPTPVGASILDLSKLCLYKLHYEEMKPRYHQNLKVCYKDTDSFLYRIEMKDLYTEKTLHYDLFKSCLFDKQPVRKSMTQLKSENHQIVVNRVKKIAVSSYNDKRFLLEDGVRSLAYGHYSLKFDDSG